MPWNFLMNTCYRGSRLLVKYVKYSVYVYMYMLESVEDIVEKERGLLLKVIYFVLLSY